jgi:hypothetical protein
MLLLVRLLGLLFSWMEINFGKAEAVVCCCVYTAFYKTPTMLPVVPQLATPLTFTV